MQWELLNEYHRERGQGQRTAAQPQLFPSQSQVYPEGDMKESGADSDSVASHPKSSTPPQSPPPSPARSRAVEVKRHQALSDYLEDRLGLNTEARQRRGSIIEECPEAAKREAVTLLAEIHRLFDSRGIAWSVHDVVIERNLLSSAAGVDIELLHVFRSTEVPELFDVFQTHIATEAQWVFLNALHKQLFRNQPLHAFLDNKSANISAIKRFESIGSASSFLRHRDDPEEDLPPSPDPLEPSKHYLASKNIPWGGSEEVFQEREILKAFIRGQDVSGEREQQLERMLLRIDASDEHQQHTLESLRQDFTKTMPQVFRNERQMGAPVDTSSVECQTDTAIPDVSVRGHDGRPLSGFSVAADGKTALSTEGSILIGPDNLPIHVDSGGWPVTSGGAKVRLIETDGKTLCLSQTNPPLHTADGREVFAADGRHFFESGREVCVGDGVVQASDGAVVLVTRTDGSIRYHCEDGRGVATEHDLPILWPDGSAVIEADTISHALLSHPDPSQPSPKIKLRPDGTPVNTSGTPVRLVSKNGVLTVLTPDRSGSVFTDSSGVLCDAEGREVVCDVNEATPLRTLDGGVVVGGEKGLVTDTGERVVMTSGDGDAERTAAQWGDGSVVIADEEGNILGPGPTKHPIRGVCINDAGDPVLSSDPSVRVTLYTTSSGKGGVLLPKDNTFTTLHGEPCTENGTPLIVHPQTEEPYRDASGKGVIRRKDGVLILEDGAVVAICNADKFATLRERAAKTAGLPSTIGSTIIAAGPDGVLLNIGTPQEALLAYNDEVVLSPEGKPRTSNGRNVRLVERDGIFAGLVESDAQGVFMDASGALCDSSGALVETAKENNTVLRSSSGSLIRKNPPTSEPSWSGQTWVDGTAIITTAGNLLDKSGAPIPNVVFKDGKPMSGANEVLLLEEKHTGKAVPVKANPYEVINNEEDVITVYQSISDPPQFYADSGERLALNPHSTEPTPYIYSEFDNAFRLLTFITPSGLRLQDGRKVPHVKDAPEIPLVWSNTSPLVISTTGKLLQKGCTSSVHDVSLVDGLLHSTVYPRSEVEVTTRDVVVARRGAKRVRVDDGKECDGEGFALCTVDGHILESADGRAIVEVLHEGETIYRTQDGAGVAQRNGKPMTWPSGEAVIADNTQRILDTTGKPIPHCELDDTTHKILYKGRDRDVILTLNDKGGPTVLRPTTDGDGDPSTLLQDDTGRYYTAQGDVVLCTKEGDPTSTANGYVVVTPSGQLKTEDGHKVAVEGGTALTLRGEVVVADATGRLSPTKYGRHRGQTLRVNNEGRVVTQQGEVVRLVGRDGGIIALTASDGLFRDENNVLRDAEGAKVMVDAGDVPLTTHEGKLVLQISEGVCRTSDGATVVMHTPEGARSPEVLLWGDNKAVIASADGTAILGPDNTKVPNVVLSDTNHAVSPNGAPVTLTGTAGSIGTALTQSTLPSGVTVLRNAKGEICTASGETALVADGVPLRGVDGQSVVKRNGVTLTADGQKVAMDASGTVYEADGVVCVEGPDQTLQNTDGEPIRTHTGPVHIGPTGTPTHKGTAVHLIAKEGKFVALTPYTEGDTFIDPHGVVCNADGDALKRTSGKAIRSPEGELVLASGKTASGNTYTGQTWSDGSGVMCTPDGRILTHNGATLEGVSWSTAKRRICNAEQTPVRIAEVAGQTLILEPVGSDGAGLYRSKETKSLHTAEGFVVLSTADPPLPVTTTAGKIIVTDVSGVMKVVNHIDNEQSLLFSESETVLCDEEGDVMTWGDGNVVIGNKSGNVLSEDGSVLAGVRHNKGVPYVVSDPSVTAKQMKFANKTALIEVTDPQITQGYEGRLYHNVSDSQDLRMQNGREIWTENNKPVLISGTPAVISSARKPITADGLKIAVDPDNLILRDHHHHPIVASVGNRLDVAGEATTLDEHHHPTVHGKPITLLHSEKGLVSVRGLQGEYGFFVNTENEVVDAKLRTVLDAAEGVVATEAGPIKLDPITKEERCLVLVSPASSEPLKTTASCELVSYHPTSDHVYVGTHEASLRHLFEDGAFPIDRSQRVLKGGAVFVDRATVLHPVASDEVLFKTLLGGNDSEVASTLAKNVFWVNNEKDRVVTAACDAVFRDPETGAAAVTTTGHVVLQDGGGCVKGIQPQPLRVALTASGAPLLVRGRAVLLSSDGRPLSADGSALVTASGQRIISAADRTLCTEDGRQVGHPTFSSLPCTAEEAEVRDAKTQRQHKVSFFLDATGSPRTLQGDKIVRRNDAPVVVDGKFLTESDGALCLEDGTAVLAGIEWPDGAPMVCESPTRNFLMNRFGTEALLGPDGAKIKVVNGRAFTNDSTLPLQILPSMSTSTAYPGGPQREHYGVQVLRASSLSPHAFVDNENRLCTEKGQLCVVDETSRAPLKTADGSLVVETKEGQGITYTKLTGPGTILVQRDVTTLCHASGSKRPLQWSDGTVATIPDVGLDPRIHTVHGQLIVGAHATPEGYVSDRHGNEACIVTTPEGGVLIRYDPSRNVYVDQEGHPCSELGERIVLSASQEPILTQDGSVVVLQPGTKNKYSVKGQPWATVARDANGEVQCWDGGTTAMTTARDGRTLMSLGGVPIPAVIVQQDGSLVSAESNGEVHLLPGAHPHDDPVVLYPHMGPNLFKNAVTGEISSKSGKKICVTKAGGSYRSSTGQIVVVDDRKLTLEDGTPVAMSPDHSPGELKPLTWSDGSAVTQVPNLKVSAAGNLFDPSSGRTACISTKDNVLLAFEHDASSNRKQDAIVRDNPQNFDGIYEIVDHDIRRTVLQDEREVVTVAGIPVRHPEKGFLLKNSLRLQDGTRVAFREMLSTTKSIISRGDIVPILWGGPSCPAIAAVDNTTVLSQDGTPLQGRNGSVRLTDESLCTLGEMPVTIVQGEEVLLLTPKLTPAGDVVVLGRRSLGGGGAHVPHRSLPAREKLLYEDQTGVLRLFSGHEVVHCDEVLGGDVVLLSSTAPTRLIALDVENEEEFFVKDGEVHIVERRVAVQRISQHTTLPMPLTWGDGTVATEIEGRIDPATIPLNLRTQFASVFATLAVTPEGIPVDSVTGERILMIGSEADFKVLIHNTVFPDLFVVFKASDDTPMQWFTYNGDEVCASRAGWPLSTPQGDYVVKTSKGLEIFSKSEGKKIPQRRVIATFNGLPVEDGEGNIATRSSIGELVYNGKAVTSVRVADTGAMTHHPSGEAALVLPSSVNAATLPPRIFRPMTMTGLVSGRPLWMLAEQNDTKQLYTEEGDAAFVHPETNDLLIKTKLHGKQDEALLTESGEICVQQHDADNTAANIVLWEATSFSEPALVTSQRDSRHVKGADGADVPSYEGVVVVSSESTAVTMKGTPVVLATREGCSLGLIRFNGIEGTGLDLFLDHEGNITVRSGERVLLSADGSPVRSLLGEMFNSVTMETLGSFCRLAVDDDGSPLFWPDGAAVTTMDKLSDEVLSYDRRSALSGVLLVDSRVVDRVNGNPALPFVIPGSAERVSSYLTPMVVDGVQMTAADGRPLYRDTKGNACLRSGLVVPYGEGPRVSQQEWQSTEGTPVMTPAPLLNAPPSATSSVSILRVQQQQQHSQLSVPSSHLRHSSQHADDTVFDRPTSLIPRTLRQEAWAVHTPSPQGIDTALSMTAPPRREGRRARRHDATDSSSSSNYPIPDDATNTIDAELRELQTRLKIGEQEQQTREELRSLSPKGGRRSTGSAPAPSGSPRNEWAYQHQLHQLHEKMNSEVRDRLEDGFAFRKERLRLGEEVDGLREEVRRLATRAPSPTPIQPTPEVRVTLQLPQSPQRRFASRSLGESPRVDASHLMLDELNGSPRYATYAEGGVGAMGGQTAYDLLHTVTTPCAFLDEMD